MGANDGSSCVYSYCGDGGCPDGTADVRTDGTKEYSHDCGEGQGTCVPAYYTMTSAGGLSFGIINIVGNFGTVFVDQSYWQSAIAAEPKATVTGFLIGGMVWFAVPFFMATTFGLAGRSLSMSKGIDFITTDQANGGLVPARTVVESIGSGGAFCLLLQLFMAVTSTGSAEVIAVSSILTYDLYWTYLNPELKEGVSENKDKWDKAMGEAGLDGEPQSIVDAGAAGKLYDSLTASGWAKKEADAKSGDDLLKGGTKLFEVKATAVADLGRTTEGVILVRMSRFFSCLFAIFMGFLSVLLNQLGLNLGWVYMAMGNIIGSAVVPCAMAILSTNANGKICTAAAIIGFICAMLGWILKANADNPDEGVTIGTMGQNDPNLIGNIVAIVSSGLICVAGSVASPEPFDWATLNSKIPVVDDVVPELKEDETPEALQKDAKRANIQAIVLTLILVLFWPIPMHLTKGVMGKGGFTIWIAVAFAWGILGGVVIIVLPILDWVKKKSPAKEASA